MEKYGLTVKLRRDGKRYPIKFFKGSTIIIYNIYPKTEEVKLSDVERIEEFL